MPRRNSNTDIPITFRVGAPPATQPRPRHRPVTSTWQTAILGMLIVTAVMTIVLGQHAANSIPASTTTSTSTGTAP